ncbi:MAG: helix-turn-helix domain-containing protein [Sulfobacillus thermotolerans]|nr:helix-turn-helix domain-containing protein [Sulfobacillus thermotolerans]
MTLREEFVERVLSNASPGLSEEMQMIETAHHIALWVQQWITDNHLPVNTLPHAVQAVAKFKQAVGAKVHVIGDNDQVTLHIDTCPIASLSRANPRLCFLTCHILGTTAALTDQPTWVRVEATWALDDQPCRLVVATQSPLTPVTMSYAAPTLYPPNPLAFWERTEKFSTSPLPPELSSLFTNAPCTVTELLASLEARLKASVWLEEHHGSVWGSPANETDVTLSHAVFWRNQRVGRLFIQPQTPHHRDLARWLPMLARIVAMTWAETQVLPVSWDESQQLLKILLSPVSVDKAEELDRWNYFAQLSSLCPARVVVWLSSHANHEEREETLLRLQQYARLNTSHAPVLVGLFQDVWVGLMPSPFTPALIAPWTAVIRQGLTVPIGIGISQDVAHLDDFPHAFDEALESARFAFAQKISTPLALSQIPGLRLLPYHRKIPAFKAYCLKLFQPLSQEDDLHHSELLTTLKTYIASQMSIKEASARLYIHPGTLKYRLKQIEGLTGWNIHDPLSLWEILTGLIVSDQLSWDGLASFNASTVGPHGSRPQETSSVPDPP